ncbi:hypothetical protein GH714_013438 [Hevea brasiliensis]|uniref:Cytochrome P450 n=1 Tax=Hevea brasiliensis TaxID=3981 RepID=A0A6A6NGW9_HEVBR|nr:hypothetical protein GH714_013438 [Hevea brasiliensis]
MHLLKNPLHKTLQNLSNQYGPIISLKFGFRNVLIISSPTLLDDCFNKNDIILANRPRLLVGEILNNNYTTIMAAPYGRHWRNLRRIAACEIFSMNSITMCLSNRQQEVRILLKDLFKNSSTSFKKVEMKSKLSELSFNIIMRRISGKRYFGEESKHIRDIISEIFEMNGSSNPEDFLPFLQWIDFQGIKKRMLRLQKELDEFAQGLIDEHRNHKNSCTQGQGRTKTMIGNMLSLQESEPQNYSDEFIKSLILSIIVAADTTVATMEWTMSLLLNHPEVLKKAEAEIRQAIGQDRLVDESDYPNLPYLQSIIKESMRFKTVGPLLIPHAPSKDCIIKGYHVPQGTMLIVNAWAVHMDPKVWEDPTSFKPERFEDLEDEAHKLIPFGLGRRACPGSGLANRVISLALASLIQCFEWERTNEDVVDMFEGIRFTVPKPQPLEALCKARESMINVLEKI